MTNHQPDPSEARGGPRPMTISAALLSVLVLAVGSVQGALIGIEDTCDTLNLPGEGCKDLDEVVTPVVNTVCEVVGGGGATQSTPQATAMTALGYGVTHVPSAGQTLGAAYTAILSIRYDLEQVAGQEFSDRFPEADPSLIVASVHEMHPDANLSTFLVAFAQELDLDATTIHDVPVEAVALLAMEALPRGGTDPFFTSGPGSQWLLVLQELWATLNGPILVETANQVSRAPFDYPTDELLLSQADGRWERAVLGSALMVYTFGQANADETLNANIGQLATQALLAQVDLMSLMTLQAAEVDCLDYGSLTDDIVTLANALMALVLQIVGDLPSVDEIQAIIMAIIEGVWMEGPIHDLLVQTNERWISTYNGPVMETAMAGIDAVDMLQLTLGGRKPSAAVSYSGSGLAVTDKATNGAPSGHATWKVDAVQTAGAVVDYEWELPYAAVVKYDQGVVSYVDTTPTVFSETDGTVSQGTDKDSAVLVLLDIPPHTDLGDSKIVDKKACAVAAGIAAGYLAGFTAAAIITGGVALAAIPPAAAAAGAAGANVGARCQMQPEEIPDEGSYVELQTYENFWLDFGWQGQPEGLDPLNVITRYGSMYSAVPAPFPSLVEFSSGNADSYYDGLRRAQDDRTTWGGVQNKAMAQFREHAGTGDAAITIQVTCLAPGEYWSIKNSDGTESVMPLVQAASTLCLRVDVGTFAAGELKVGDDGEISFTGEGVDADSGYVEVNGNRQDSPVLLQVDGGGPNYDQLEQACATPSYSINGEEQGTEQCI